MIDSHSDKKLFSKVFPDAADMARRKALRPAQQREFIVRSEQAGFESGVAPAETLAARLARVRA